MQGRHCIRIHAVILLHNLKISEMKRTIQLLCVILVLATTVISCGKSGASKASLREKVEEISAELPMSMGLSSTFTSIEYDEDSNIVTILMTLNPEYVTVSMLNKSDETAQMILLQGFTGTETSAFTKAIIDADAILKCTYTNPTGDESYSVSITADQLKKYKDDTADMSDAEKITLSLETSARMTNLSTPSDLGEGIVMENMVVNDDEVVYNYTIDDAVCDFNLLKDNADELKQIMSSAIESDLSMMQLVENCKKSNRAIIYRYKSSGTGEVCDIVFSPDEF